MHLRKFLVGLGSLFAVAVIAPAAASTLTPAPVVTSPRVYVINCGYVITDTPEEHGLTNQEIEDSLLSDVCFLIVHPKGTLLWETGLPDRITNRPIYENIQVTGAIHKAFLRTESLVSQLADIGYTPAMIDYLSLSHHHPDHSGNANLFARTARWLVSRQEWNAMFRPANRKPVEGSEDFGDLKTAKTVFIGDNYDVFGDGTVVITQAFGHTPGHSILQLRLKNTGNVILGGDIYTYQQERARKRIGSSEGPGAAQARAKVEELLSRTNAQLWLDHDIDFYKTARHAPAFYD